jgi:RNA polymerase sigma-70 factor, ECF subfamily
VHEVDESTLISQAQRGDRDAFAELVTRYWSRVFHWLHGVTRCAHSAEDLTQDVFVRAWQALPRFEAGNFRGWLFRIARNRLTDFHRDKGAAKGSTLPKDAPAKDADPLTQVISGEHRVAVDQACGMLPEAVRSTFLLWVREEMAYEEIAKILDISVATARWRVYKARRLLERLLASTKERKEP